LSARGRHFDGVADEVQEDLGQPAAVAAHARQARVETAQELHAALVARTFDRKHLFDDLVHVDARLVETRGPGQVEQLG